jgi:outer membrane protein assembly factor BamB
MRLARAVAALFAIATLLMAAGCSTPSSYNPLRWMGIMDPPVNQPTPLTEIKSPLVAPRVSWNTNVGKAGGFNFRPVIQTNRVFSASADGNVTILEETSGRVLSRFDTKKRLSGGVEVIDNKVIVGSLKGEVLALDTSGKTLWQTLVTGEVIAPASASRKIIVVRTAEGRIYGLSVEDGKRLWVYQRQTPSLLLRSDAGVLAIGGDVVAGYPGGKVIALDLEDGKLTWEATVSTPRGATDLERIADVAGMPMIDGPRVCAVAFQGKVACFEIQTRNVVWSRDLSSAHSLVADAKNIYVVDDTSNVHALDKNSGASVWKQAKLLNRRLTSPVVFDGRIVVGDLEGYLHVLAAEDGAIIGRVATDGSAVRSITPTLSGLVVQTEKGSVAMVRF